MPALPERERQRADVALLGLEARGRARRAPRARCPAARAAIASARASSVRAQPVARAALAAQVGERALVDDAPASRTIATRSHSSCTSGSWWLESSTVMPSSASRRISARMSRIPAGSRPVAGSSRISRRGRRSSAAAIPRRWRMPCE